MALSAKIAKSIALIQNPSIEMVSKKSISFKLLDSIAVDSASLMPADVAKIILLLNHTEPAVITTAFCFLICISKNRPDLKRHMMAYAFPQAVLKLTSLDNPCIEGALDFLIELLRYNPDVDAITDSLYSNADVRHTFAIILSHQLPLAEKIQALISVTSSPDLESVLK